MTVVSCGLGQARELQAESDHGPAWNKGLLSMFLWYESHHTYSRQDLLQQTKPTSVLPSLQLSSCHTTCSRSQLRLARASVYRMITPNCHPAQGETKVTCFPSSFFNWTVVLVGSR